MITERKLKVVFYGTDEFAVPSLVAMVEAGWKPAAVVTGPDRESLKNAKTAIKELATKGYATLLQADGFGESSIFVH